MMIKILQTITTIIKINNTKYNQFLYQHINIVIYFKVVMCIVVIMIIVDFGEYWLNLMLKL